jgi:bifunctional non-homologous end joining protein LigD
VPAGAGQFWVDPLWVAEVRFKEETPDGLLRAPVFVRLRDDKRPEECVRAPAKAEEPPELPPAPATPVRPPAPEVRFSNLEKLYWPEDGITKGDLIQYHETVAPWLLPYLKDRPLVLTRYPDGIHGKSFYQKNAPDFVPDWIRTETIWSEHAQKEIAYFVCNDVETLLYLVNLGTIPLHVWSSRVGSIPHPDWCILDLDPKGAPFANVVTLARAIYELCEEIGLPSFVKTSGSTGLHVLLPLGGQTTYEQSRMLGHLLARVIEARHPDIATTARNIAARKGRVYLDYLQNRHGQLLVSPYSVRPLPGAPVSAPLTWEEVTQRLTPQRFTVLNLPARLERRSEDPVLPVLETRPDLIATLGSLSRFLDDKARPR